MSVPRLLSIALVLAAGCSKSSPDSGANQGAPPPKPAAVAATVGADGMRHISVEANEQGYHPDRIAGKPGEKIVLSVTRTTDAECLAQLKTPDGTVVDLPRGKATDVAIVVPKSGEAAFTCGMGMYKGTIVADTSL
jgi:plastocyanin domain-containing protein